MRAWSGVAIDGGCILLARRADTEPRNSSALHSIPATASPQGLEAHPRLKLANWRRLPDKNLSRPWDGKGGRHCPSYVKGWDPHKREWVERITTREPQKIVGPLHDWLPGMERKAWIDQPDTCVCCE